ncbi:MAG: thioesterase [Candidatus Cloacimonadota bacterium]|nr:MAG: thioesterase [Candidatus Cloacimonadota bacterium]
MKIEYKRRIFGYECDIYGHLNNANYLHLYEEARAAALEQMKMPIGKFKEMGFNIYLTHIELDFIKAINLEERITIRTSIAEMNRLKAVWKQEIYNSKNELCNMATVIGVFVKNDKPARISKELYTYFTKFIG